MFACIRPAALTTALLLGAPAFAGVSASSELKGDEPHPASHAVDGLLSTAWAEGDEGDGTGAWIEVRLDKTTDVQSVSLWPGRFDQGSRGLREYGRPHTVTVTLKGGDEEVSEQVRVLDIAETGPTRLDIPIQGTARSVRIALDEVYKGGIRNDTYITEVAVNFAGGPVHPAVTKTAEWLGSSSGTKAANAHSEDVLALEKAIGEEEFGDRDSMGELKEAAADGPEYLQERVRRYVPDGFRMSALQSSQDALNALLALEDPNAIPALELAATRAQGDFQATLLDRVSRFRAFQDLKGGPKRNVKAFGETGYCKGCLQSFGEPMGVAVDQFGGLWVADLGNHRVQRFDLSGIAQQEVGKGEPALSNDWLASKRDWYAAGRESAQEDGAFALPLDIGIWPDKKEGDRPVVLDAAGRITILNADGSVKQAWAIGIEGPVSPGVGGEGHLAVAGKNIVAIWGNEAFVYDLEGAEVGTFTLEDGVANGIVGFKNGKFATVHGDTLVEYSPDGFRHGDILDGSIPDGFEYWDALTDDKGKLWVVTDHGLAIKYKKPGKIDYQVEFVDYSLGPPRAAVVQDVLFVTNDDAILKRDALELQAQPDLPGAP